MRLIDDLLDKTKDVCNKCGKDEDLYLIEFKDVYCYECLHKEMKEMENGDQLIINKMFIV